jgi:hypothetical protein
MASWPPAGALGDGHRPEQLRLRPQQRHVGQAVPAQYQGHRQVGDDLPRGVHRPGGPPPFQRGVQAAVQASYPQRLGQQQAAGLGDDSGDRLSHSLRCPSHHGDRGLRCKRAASRRDYR